MNLFKSASTVEMVFGSDISLCVIDILLYKISGFAVDRPSLISHLALFCQAVGLFEVFGDCPTVKFKLCWNHAPLYGTVDEAEIEMCQEEECDGQQNNDFTTDLCKLNTS